jgi:hypothetical protein
MLEKVVAALKANEADAVAAFNKPDGGFRDRDLEDRQFHRIRMAN